MDRLDANNSKMFDLEDESFRRLLLLQDEINQLIDKILSKRVYRLEKDTANKHVYIPPIDIYDSENSYKVVIELPGLVPTDVEVNIANGFLEIKGTRKRIIEDKDIIVQEISFGSFYRSFPLPGSVDLEKKCCAIFSDGILTIDFAKFDQSKLKQRKFSIKLDRAN